MTLSLFDAQLFEKVCNEKYKDKTEFSKTDVLNILNEMTKSEKYYPRGKIQSGSKYRVFKYFVRYCFYRNCANFDSLILLSGEKGCFIDEEKIKTPFGNISIQGLNLDDKDRLEVIAFDFEMKKEVIAEAQYFNTGIKDVYTIELENGKTITTTEDHTFFVNRKNKIIELKLKDIKETDELVISND